MGEKIEDFYVNKRNITVFSSETSISFSVYRLRNYGELKCESHNIDYDMLVPFGFNFLETKKGYCNIIHLRHPATITLSGYFPYNNLTYLMWKDNTDQFAEQTKVEYNSNPDSYPNTTFTTNSIILYYRADLENIPNTYSIGITEMTAQQELPIGGSAGGLWTGIDPDQSLVEEFHSGFGEIEVSDYFKKFTIPEDLYIVFLDNMTKIGALVEIYGEKKKMFGETKYQAICNFKLYPLEMIILSDETRKIRYVGYKNFSHIMDFDTFHSGKELITMIGNAGKFEVRPFRNCTYYIFVAPQDGTITISYRKSNGLMKAFDADNNPVEITETFTTDKPMRFQYVSESEIICNISQTVPKRENSVDYVMNTANRELLNFGLYLGYGMVTSNPDAKYYEEQNNQEEKKLSVGQIAGIAVGVIIGIIVIVLIVLVILRKNNKIHQSSESSSSSVVCEKEGRKSDIKSDKCKVTDVKKNTEGEHPKLKLNYFCKETETNSSSTCDAVRGSTDSIARAG